MKREPLPGRILTTDFRASLGGLFWELLFLVTFGRRIPQVQYAEWIGALRSKSMSQGGAPTWTESSSVLDANYNASALCQTHGSCGHAKVTTVKEDGTFQAPHHYPCDYRHCTFGSSSAMKTVTAMAIACLLGGEMPAT